MISLIIVSNMRFGDYVGPYIESVLRYEPETEIIITDLTKEGNRYNYHRGLNSGAKRAKGDWLIFSNDDVLCTNSFSEMIENFDKNCIHGKELRRKTEEKWGFSVEYLYGFILVMHRSLFEKVGEFDEVYGHAGFDDIDYCWRAQEMGFNLQAHEDLPFLHLADLPGASHRRYLISGYSENMKKSKEHFLEKTKVKA